MTPSAMPLASQVFLITLLGAIAPMAVVGYWLTASAAKSGTALLHDRLDATLATVSQELGDAWVRRRSALLAFAEDPALVHALEASAADAPALTLRRAAFSDVRDATQLVIIRDNASVPRWVLGTDEAGGPRLLPAADSLRAADPRGADVMPVSIPVYASAADSRAVGSLDVRLRATSLVTPGIGSSAGAGAVIAIFDRASGTAIVPLPFDIELLSLPRFEWEGRQWLTARRRVEDPAVDLYAAAPLDPYVTPFERASRRGLIALIVVALAALAIAAALTRQVARSLEQLADAADAVAAGDLDRQVAARGGSEVRRVAHAFNAMTENLRRTLRVLSQRQAVTAVGEFASALAHEVRNPLSAMRLNLQHVEERLPGDDELRVPVAHSLRDIDRLERTVAGVLRVARSGRMLLEPTDLWTAIDAAARAAEPELLARDATLELPASEHRTRTTVRGDAAALEQVFLNLLLNAIQALPRGGRCGVDVTSGEREVIATVWDEGSGMTEEQQRRAMEPFFSTKPEGTGLGLSTSHRIVAAHHGTLYMESAVGAGTRVRVSLPTVHAT